jgi:hypothetical protein
MGGKDGYTGFDLDPRFMELEHIVGTSEMIRQENGTMRPPTLEEYRQREHPDNWIWTSTGINSFKGERPLLETLDKLNGMKERIDEGEEKWGVDLEEGIIQQDKKQKGLSSLVEGMFDENGNFTDEATPESISALFEKELKDFQELNPRSRTVPVDIAKTIAKKLRMARSFQTNGSNYMDEQILRPIIMNILNSDDRMSKRGDYQVQWLRARKATKDMYDMGEKAVNYPEYGQFAQIDNGEYNVKGTFGKMFYPWLAEHGLLKREDLENESFFPTAAQRKALKKKYGFLFDVNESYVHDDNDYEIYQGIDFKTFLG